MIIKFKEIIIEIVEGKALLKQCGNLRTDKFFGRLPIAIPFAYANGRYTDFKTAFGVDRNDYGLYGLRRLQCNPRLY